jgi:hypothetical protein
MIIEEQPTPSRDTAETPLLPEFFSRKVAITSVTSAFSAEIAQP